MCSSRDRHAYNNPCLPHCELQQGRQAAAGCWQLLVMVFNQAACHLQGQWRDAKCALKLSASEPPCKGADELPSSALLVPSDSSRASATSGSQALIAACEYMMVGWPNTAPNTGRHQVHFQMSILLLSMPQRPSPPDGVALDSPRCSWGVFLNNMMPWTGACLRDRPSLHTWCASALDSPRCS